jgi:hypothetical protein
LIRGKQAGDPPTGPGDTKIFLVSYLEMARIGNLSVIIQIIKFRSTIMKNFNGYQWDAIGPVLLSSALRKLCNLTELKPNNCSGFNVLPIQTCFPVIGMDFHKFYKHEYVGEVMENVKDALVVHFWNHLWTDAERNISSNENVPYIHLAKKFCPTVIANCGPYF